MSRIVGQSVLLFSLCTPINAAADDVPAELSDEASAWGELTASAGTVYAVHGAVYFVLGTETPKSLTFPRLANRLQSVHWMGRSPRAVLPLKPGTTEWTIPLSSPPDEPPRVVIVEVDGDPQLATAPALIKANDQHELTLPAHLAVTHGENLRYEPQPHKDTIGYWTNPNDWAEWHVEIASPGMYEVDLLQGCGTGQGGSDVDIVLLPEAGGDVITMPFNVVETGHFQSFRRVSAGLISLRQPGRYRVQLRPTKLAGRAVMDVREVRLFPAKQRRRVNPRRPPHVLLFFTDDQGTLDAGCYGSRDLFTPFMDGLANDGVRFTQAYAHTVCCPARALLMTGRHPQRSGVNDWMQGQIDQEPTDRQGRNMSLDEVTLAEHLSAHGYRTALFGKWHLGGDRHHGPTR